MCNRKELEEAIKIAPKHPGYEGCYKQKDCDEVDGEHLGAVETWGAQLQVENNILKQRVEELEKELEPLRREALRRAKIMDGLEKDMTEAFRINRK